MDEPQRLTDRMRQPTAESVATFMGTFEREKAKAVLPDLALHARDDYVNATTYHDGRWVLIDVDSDAALDDVKRLLLTKRRPSGGRRRET